MTDDDNLLHLRSSVLPLQPSSLEQPSPLKLRSLLEEMVVKDLRGPTTPDEEIDEPSVRDRYLVGMLAPRRQETDDHFASGSVEVDDDVDDTGGDFPPDDPIAIGCVDSIDEGATELTPPQPKAIFPSSFGMTFSVALEITEIQVSAKWGQYLREPSEHITTQKGNPKRVWKRYQRGGIPHTVKVTQGSIISFDADHACPDVRIEGVMRQRDDHWSITLFLVNQQQEPDKLRDQMWVFQPELTVEATDGSAIFDKKPSRVDLAGTDESVKAENDMLNMLYRRNVEFAVGHGVGVHVDESPDDPTRAVRISTRVVPDYEVPKTGFPEASDAELNPAFRHLDGVCRDMYELAETPPDQLRSKLEPLVTAYEEWIDLETGKIDNPDEGLDDYRHVAETALDHCRRTLERIRQGISLLDPSSDEHDPLAVEAFLFMNRAMWLQRTHSIFSEAVRRGEEEPDFEGQIDVPQNRSWRPFQLAFVLLNLPGITRFDHPERGTNSNAIADLLWFPTGGGKTEAYLGLTAYTLGLRRLQGVVEGRDGENGVTVLMRYTLRLLTLQQFQRATALICACEDIRRDALTQGDRRWGLTPFRIGLWVGNRATPNKTSQSDESVKSAHGGKPKSGSFGGGGSPHQLTNCPWCGSKIDPGKNITVEKYNQGRGRTLVFCGNKYGQCKFSKREAPKEGLPVLVVDEEIYRNLPSLLITTVDKFAQMPWNGATEMLFGQVDGICERHGFRSPEIEDKDSHTKSKSGLPAAKTVPTNPLRPPDLIIQDELHLISGPLGTLVGLYETAIDKLCTWQVNGHEVRPKVIASTATIRRAEQQMHSLFMRKLNVFPPPGLDVRDNFFSLQRPCSEKYPGRRYIGICAPGRRLKAALIRVYVAFLSAGQVLFEQYGRHADPWMTLVGYFNSLRELGGMKRLVDDDIRNRLGRMDERGLAQRRLYSPDTVKELTSRLGSTAIPETLDLLEGVFDPAVFEAMKKRKPGDEYKHRPLDVLLATNMISVGVDVPRLGLMVTAGQPKTTAEYIQATSRVGRKYPGLVCTVFNWARPRDLSHYETFENYHATFYRHVEALSVTPFSSGATYRGLSALLVSLVRLQGTEFNGNERAMLMATKSDEPGVREIIEAITNRAAAIAGPEVGDDVRDQLERKLDHWQNLAQRMTGGSRLGYQTKKDGQTIGLLRQPSTEPWTEFTCLNSLREVEPTANLILNDHGLDDDYGGQPVAEQTQEADA